MNNLPIVLGSESNPPVLPENLLAQYSSYAEQMMSGFQGAFNRIKVGKMDFGLVEGGVTRRMENGQVMGVCLGMSSVDHCSWYENTYDPTQEPEAPDLLWLWSDRSKFPAALPAQWHQKKNRQGQDRWDFRIARRSVWALLQPHPASGQYFLNVETPFVFDITSASLYGNSDTTMNWYKWAGLIQMCNRFSQPPNFICSPAMFITRIRIDPTSTVSGVVYFEPMMSQNGTPVYLDSNTFAQVVEVMQSQTIRDMLQVREILEWPKTSVQTAGQSLAQATGQSVPDPITMTATAQQAQQVSNVPPMQTATAVTQPTPEPQTFVSMQQPAQPQTAPQTQTAATAQTAAPVAAETDSDTQSRLAMAQAILNQDAAGPSAQAATVGLSAQEAAALAQATAALAEPAQPASTQNSAASSSKTSNVNADTADAIRAFSNVLI